MCGLIAYYKTSERPLDPSLIEDMTHALKHRGPDDYGFCFVGEDGPILWRDGGNLAPFKQKGVAMGHRRLSVFDLTEVGRQPYVSADKRLALVFNGEIYNFIELREELVRHGFHFSTDCDTEVLLAAFEKWGTDCFNRLNGVWAIVLWDDRAKELIAARDRLGEKPLLYTRVDGDWIFGSEVKALLKHPGIAAQPNEQSLLQFIANGWDPRGEETFFSGIRSVEPGTFLTFRDGAIAKKTTFWNLSSLALPPRRDEKAAVEELDSLLTDAVRLRLRGDIRIGAMLSGGLDSTSVISSIGTVLASRPSDGRMIGDCLQAFTASFPGTSLDETDKVEELCRSIEIAAHKVYPAEQDGIEERLNEVAWGMEAPFWSPAIIVHDSLMKLIRSTDTQIVLDGIGGDEIFAGFERHVTNAVRDNLHALHIGAAIGNLNGMHKKLGRSFLKEAMRAGLPRRLQKAVRNFRGHQPDWYSELFCNPLRPQEGAGPSIEGTTRLDRALKRDLLWNNMPRWLQMGDRITMANSVVGRSPLLDYRILEFAFSLDDNLKIRNGVTKYVLRQARRDQLPASIVNDFRKVQFSGPGMQWLQGPLKGFAQSLKNGKTSKISAFLRGDALAKIIGDYYQAKQPSRGATWRLWRIVSAEAWLRAYS